MRLDHLLSKEKIETSRKLLEVGVVLLSSCQGAMQKLWKEQRVCLHTEAVRDKSFYRANGRARGIEDTEGKSRMHIATQHN